MKLVQIKCNGEMNDLDIPINLKNIKPVATLYFGEIKSNWKSL